MDSPRLELSHRERDAQVIDQARSEGFSAFQAHLIASRGLHVPAGWSVASALQPPIHTLDDPHQLPDFEQGTQRLAQAIRREESILIETDHDVDGVSSHATIHEALLAMGHPAENIHSEIGHRLREGYGLSDPVADRILEKAPSVVITADNGSADEPRIARLKEAGIDVIVTDHHGMPPEGPPQSALACISPARTDSAYPDSAIAGVMVSWLLMVGTQVRLGQQGFSRASRWRPQQSLDFVALGTVADCVSMAGSVNNRAVVHNGLRLMERNQRPCWEVMREPLRIDAEKGWQAEDISFGLGPRINARGRLDEAMAGVHFLLSETLEEALSWSSLLEEENTQRKSIEQRLKLNAFVQAQQQMNEDRQGLAIFLQHGHPGVHGIVASRVVERFGRPTICLSEHFTESGVLTGSARGVDGSGIHVLDAFRTIHEQDPTLLLKFGGHEGAGGFSIPEDRLADFQQAWDTAIQAQGACFQAPVWKIDGQLKARLMSLESAREMDALRPFGKGFPQPVFSGEFVIQSVRAIGDGRHLKLSVTPQEQVQAGQPGGVFEAVSFNCKEPHEDVPFQRGDVIRAVYKLDINRFRGEERLQLLVDDLAPAQAPAQRTEHQPARPSTSSAPRRMPASRQAASAHPEVQKEDEENQMRLAL